ARRSPRAGPRHDRARPRPKYRGIRWSASPGRPVGKGYGHNSGGTTTMRMLALSLLVAAAVLAGKAAAPAAGPQTITGTDGPGFTITLKQHGKTVKDLAPASYAFVINDDSNIHNF